MKGNGKIIEGTFVATTLDTGQRKLAAGKDATLLATFLEVEHMRHGGTMNGKLKAPHRQLAALGIRRANIARAITRAEAAGLIEVTHRGMRTATLFRLTYGLDRKPGGRSRPSRSKSHHAERNYNMTPRPR